MEFSNLLFLYILLPVTLLIYFLLPDMKKKNLALLVISLIFCALGRPFGTALLAALSYLNYILALRIDSQDRSTVLLPVAINISALFMFRYLDFLLKTLNASFLMPPSLEILGIAFYALSAISYLADVYRGWVEPEENFLNLLLYFMMFPKFLGGPIVRYEEIAPQLEARRHHPRAVFEGMQRFLIGLAKKVLLADHCRRILEEVNASGADTTLIGVWFAAILFLFWIYYAFSGYSDMAIGLGRIFGFRFCENFDYPYTVLSVKDFIRRWNQSLFRFLRDYVYLPLGGKELGKSRQLVNILIACMLGGLWYGAGWNYAVWGAYMFLVLALEKHVIPTLETLPDSVCRCVTLWLILVGWILFSHESIPDLQAAFLATLGFGGMAIEGLGTLILNSIPLAAVCVLGCTRLPLYAGRIFAGVCGMGPRRKQGNLVTPLRAVYLLVNVLLMGLLLWLCTVSLVGAAGTVAY